MQKYKIVNKNKLLATAFLDGIGRLAFRALPPRPEGSAAISPEEMRSILLIRTAYIGDVVMTLPMLRPLRERFPKSRITFLVAPGAAPLLQGNPFVDEVVSFAPFWFYPAGMSGLMEYVKFIRSLRKRTFDLLIEARGDIREILLLAAPARSRHKVGYGFGGGAYLLTHVVPWKGIGHKVDDHLGICRFLGCPDGPVDWGMRIAPSERAQAEETLASLGVRPPYVCAHPGSRLPLKIWPVEHCAKLYDLLLERFRLPLLLFGSRSDLPLIGQIASRMQGQAVNLAGRTTLREMAVLLEQASLFVCNDSAPMHVAASLGVPTIAIFGPSKSMETRPFGNAGQVVENNFPCRFSCDESSCVRRTKQECMRTIAPESVLRAAEKILDTGRESNDED